MLKDTKNLLKKDKDFNDHKISQNKELFISDINKILFKEYMKNINECIMIL